MNSTKKITILALTIAMLTIPAFAIPKYPPDNAAVLYYKASLMYEAPEGDLGKQLSNFVKGDIEINDAISTLLASEQDAIETVTAAAKVSKCQWGYDYSEGFDLQLPVLAHMRNLSRIVLADAIVQIEQKNWSAAIQHCRTTYAMANHLKTDSILICNLVGIAIDQMTNSVMTNILSSMPADKNALARIDSLLDIVSANNNQIVSCLKMEAEIVTKHTDLVTLRQTLADMAGGDKDKLPAFSKETIDKLMSYIPL